MHECLFFIFDHRKVDASHSGLYINKYATPTVLHILKKSNDTQYLSSAHNHAGKAAKMIISG
jgi:hypothetical protein